MNAFPEMPEFVPGLELAEGFYRDIVRPLLDKKFPSLQYAAALMGHGSEVLGFDDAMSRDHHWGPRLMLFLKQEDYKTLGEPIHDYLAEHLPVSYRGYTTNFSPPDPEDNNNRLLQPVASGPVNHRVETYTIEGYCYSYLNINLDDELHPADWLTLPHQKLRAFTAGRVFHDDLGLAATQKRFDWYPHDIWLYVMASVWQRIGQEEHLMGRAGMAGDEIGSAIIGSRLVRDCMTLAFLMEKQYPPYAKWFGSAFDRLNSSTRLKPALEAALQAVSWQPREDGLSNAYEILAGMHNSLGVTGPLPEKVSRFWSRPLRVIKGESFAAALLGRITDPAVKALDFNSPIGSIDIFSDNTDLLEDAALRPAIRHLYE